MGNGQKRKLDAHDASSREIIHPVKQKSIVHRDLLERCYPHVKPLRQYLLYKLPTTSRLRRKKITLFGSKPDCSEVERHLSHLLDTCLVCMNNLQPVQDDTRWANWLSFSQRGDESYVTVSGGPEAALYSQREIVEFVIWLLFSRETRPGCWPKHLICDGFRKGTREGINCRMIIPGVYTQFENPNVAALQADPWPQVLALLGQSGESVMIDLLMDCSVFIKIETGFSNYYQLNGLPLSELGIFETKPSTTISQDSENNRKPSDISLIRSRIFYAKPSVTAKNALQTGLKAIHVLNRCKLKPTQRDIETTTSSDDNTVRVMMYIFPRMFGLHNVFTSQVDSRTTTQKFHDYTVRDEEISDLLGSVKKSKLKIPKRLRGEPYRLVRRLQINHARCSYFELLRHYCPCSLDSRLSQSTSAVKNSSQPLSTVNETHNAAVSLNLTHLSQQRSVDGGESDGKRHLPDINKKLHSVIEPFPLDNSPITDLASSTHQVYLFCQRVLSNIIPSAFWGNGDAGSHNKKIFLQKIHHFIHLRRFESINLHEIGQGFKLMEMTWLRPPHLQNQNPSQSETKKCLDIFYEFIYYIFDSLLIPLLRNNFYITESNTDRYQVFYFRQDVWKAVTEPTMLTLKHTMFEEFKPAHMQMALSARKLGFAQIRLLPKGSKLRPITNLRRRTNLKGDSKLLSRSINSILSPVHTLLRLEKNLNPDKLGSSLFSVGEIYARLKAFRKQLEPVLPKLYFAKVDVQAAFDTIPQDAILRLMGTIPSNKRLRIGKHVEVRPGERMMAGAKPIRRWHATGQTMTDTKTLLEYVQDTLTFTQKGTVFIGSAAKSIHETRTLLDLMAEHVDQNLIKVGKKLYRQKRGIPQGSVLSSFLCNYFYADLERTHLSFLNSKDCVLMRLIDDFILITTDKFQAERFVTVMHGGLPDYGVRVSEKKTMVNFNMTVEGEMVCKVANGAGFPYCGTLIDCQTLDITKDQDRNANQDITNTLTVEYGRCPGQNFERKVINAFKIQSHHMFFDTSHNATITVLETLRSAFTETARKMVAYIRSLATTNQQPPSSLIIRTVAKTIDVAYLILSSRSRKMRFKEYEFQVRKAQVESVGYDAFLQVLSKKQTNHLEVVDWLRGQSRKMGPKSV